MKKMIFIAVLAVFSYASAQAQEVLNAYKSITFNDDKATDVVSVIVNKENIITLYTKVADEDWIETELSDYMPYQRYSAALEDGKWIPVTLSFHRSGIIDSYRNLNTEGWRYSDLHGNPVCEKTSAFVAIQMKNMLAKEMMEYLGDYYHQAGILRYVGLDEEYQEIDIKSLL